MTVQLKIMKTVNGKRAYTRTWMNLVLSDRVLKGPVRTSGDILDRWGGRRIDTETIEFDDEDQLLSFVLRWA